jgi:ribosomal subunit interface protein
MTFPLIQTKTTNYTVTPQIESLLEQKFAPLGRFLEGKHEVRCEVELEKIGDHHAGKIFRAEVNLHVGGTLFRAEATEEQMEQSIDAIRDDVKRELQKNHEKRQSLAKRGRQMLKDMLRFGK